MGDIHTGARGECKHFSSFSSRLWFSLPPASIHFWDVQTEMKKLPLHRWPVPYENPVKAEAYRAGYLAWPNEAQKPDRDFEHVDAWIHGWSDARDDDPEAVPSE